MKPISTKSKNFRAAAEKAIREAEGRATARTLSPDDIINALERAEKRFGVPKKALDGTTISVDVHAQGFPAAYNGVPLSTIFRAENRRGTWYLVDVSRAQTRAPSRALLATLSDTARAAILDQASCSAL